MNVFLPSDTVLFSNETISRVYVPIINRHVYGILNISTSATLYFQDHYVFAFYRETSFI